jgi:hypothetical protein
MGGWVVNELLLQRHRRAAITPFVAALAFVAVVMTVIGGCRSSQPSAKPAQAAPNPQTTQEELPFTFTGLHSPGGVAVDTAGDV